MTQRSLSTNITVTIGAHSRIYAAFITTAPADLDSPATLTLQAASLAEVAGFAAEPLDLDWTRSRVPARLILVEAMELPWQRAKCLGNHHAFLSADPVLVDLNTLQHWLWRRLQAAATPVVA